MITKKSNQDKVIFFDTTSRDGKQAPGNNHSPEETVLLARHLAEMGVDVMEAGFPISSDADFKSVRYVAEEVAGIKCAALARARNEDIECAARAFKNAITPPRIHVFIASSDIHLKDKLRMSEEQVISVAVNAIRKARSYVDDVEFSPEDASRTGFDFLKRIVKATIEAGANTINIPDTVGYAVPKEFGDMIARLNQEVYFLHKHNATLSVHCHNDLGMATANTLAGIKNGARQAHCTINGIGERAGNTHFAEVVMALKTRRDYFGVNINIDTAKIGPTARFLSSVIGKSISDTLPIVGENVFAHSAGVHQDGMNKSRKTYEIMSPELVGWKGELFPLSSQSGRQGLKKRLADIGYTAVDQTLLNTVYAQFIALANTKKLVYNADLHMLMQEINGKEKAKSKHWIRLVRCDYHKVNEERTVVVRLAVNGNEFEASGTGDGPIHSAWSAIKNALQRNNYWPGDVELKSFDIGKSVGGVEACGLAQVQIAMGAKTAYGRGVNTDIVIAYIQAELSAINHLVHTPIIQT
ncbi:2-isopropylmalate synthase [Patescibacteria group bacterium]|nr:2-isopropylmalate synthase [Patescibacteria group bacterium]MBU1160738.1 2-isopropylmalate synthase [Patescibacteria group bacterium]MBU1730265.1 2-isopropylmalate synthase [Patescibacteria group bacterium]MBU2010453.1 2-isopropylmalate synthase [Patescibacteria group bacterium]